jgi:hypothetical protein
LPILPLGLPSALADAGFSVGFQASASEPETWIDRLDPTKGRGMLPSKLVCRAVIAIGMLLTVVSTCCVGEPPALNPFGKTSTEREDAVQGVVELSDGSIHPGMIYLTRDKRLQVYDERLERQREIPLQAVKKIECTVKKEWTEKEWKFKEGASDEKLYTGRSYPAREYLHTITLKSGKTITGPVSTIVYVQPLQKTTDKPSEKSIEPERFMLNKRNKGELGQKLKALVYVKRIKLGKDAMEEAKGEKKKAMNDER